MLAAQEGRGFALSSFQFGVEEEVATELSDPSSVMPPLGIALGVVMDFGLLFFSLVAGGVNLKRFYPLVMTYRGRF